jgi:hypothetical protein
MESTPQAPIIVKRQPTTVGSVFWALSFLGAVAGGGIAYVGVVSASGAPQEAAAAAIGCCVAIVPYVIARSVDELVR